MEGAKATGYDTRTAGGKLRWTLQMECLLIDVWQENMEQLRGSRKNSHIYMEMAQTLMEAGNDVSWKDIKTKVDNMTKKYKQEKHKMGPSGGAPSAWQHFEALHSFLGSFRVHNMEQDTVDNENTTEYFTEEYLEDVEETSMSGSRRSGSLPPAKRAKVDQKSELVEIARERLEEQKTQTEILQRMADSQEKFQSELLRFLRESKQ
ncbi:myb/SANT-like DNA-binding domain-containing protein 1 [Drosophila kikkawai]|uniref:Myb/SANT-like DNA-binding domain-containing protein 1 n=1 Tax=Drosophila kikkawai TaxID=30033 RepID=A0ABM3C7Y2_DROKI|nr:myb/SANT-like DNA-binding domain-containing protein 1 [Drosophila kikkawai]